MNLRGMVDEPPGWWMSLRANMECRVSSSLNMNVFVPACAYGSYVRSHEVQHRCINSVVAFGLHMFFLFLCSRMVEEPPV